MAARIRLNFVNNYYKPGPATTFFYALNAQNDGFMGGHITTSRATSCPATSTSRARTKAKRRPVRHETTTRG